MSKYLEVRWPVSNPDQVSPFVITGNDLETVAVDADIDQIDEFDLRGGRFHYGVKDTESGQVVYRSTCGLGGSDES